jgi:hypothetical protein
MTPNKLYFNSALKALENKKNFLVWWFPFNGIIRANDGEEVGTLSTQIIDKLIKSDKLEFHCYGSGLLDHERYYTLIKR